MLEHDRYILDVIGSRVYIKKKSTAAFAIKILRTRIENFISDNNYTYFFQQLIH